MAGLNKEIWIDKLKENFFAKYSFIDAMEDWGQWVEYNTINYASMGTNPTILKNNSSWPIAPAQRTDSALTIVLDTYDSTTTRVRNLEEIESSYNKLDSVINQHKDSLNQEIAKEGLHNVSPATAGAGAYAVTGANRAVAIAGQDTVAGTLALDDLAGMKERWDAINAPDSGRVAVLNPYHVRDLLKQDTSLTKELMNLKAGEPLPIFGIDFYVSSLTPVYAHTTLAIATYGAAAAPTTDCVSSIGFISSESFKCLGDMEMFYKEKAINPEERSDEVGFQVRAKIGKQRAVNNLFQALVSDRA